MMKGAKKIVEILAGVQPGEKVIIVTDTNLASVGECLATATYQIGADPFLVITPPLKREGSHATRMPDLLISAMSEADVILAPTTDSTTSSIREAIEKSGGQARGLSLAGLNEEMLYKGGIEADFDEIAETTHAKLVEIFKKAKKGEVTTPSGTHLKVDLVPRGPDFLGYPGIAREPGQQAGPPDIEVNCRVVQGTATGSLVVDGAICIYPDLGVLKETVTLEIRKGKITEIKGGREATIFKELYDEMLAEDPKAENLAEFACGLNTSAFLTGNYFEDEGSGETMHFGFGGGSVGGIYHNDFVITKPTLLINGELVLKDGKVV